MRYSRKDREIFPKEKKRKKIKPQKLLIITTGGTIASTDTEEKGLAPTQNGLDFIPVVGDAEIYILDLYGIDSTDMSPAHWKLLYDAVTKNLPKYDGIVILHGTDTMAYTGAVLAFTVNTDKPVILTGSMLPSGASDSDAPDNILFACENALNKNNRGVWLAFHDRLIGGADIHKINSSEKDAFRRYSGFKVSRTLPFPEKPEAFPAVVKLSPFMSGDDLRRSADGHKSVIIETYGAGGLPAGEITDTVRELAKKARVTITTPCIGGTNLDRYEAGRRALDAGAVSGGMMSTECAAVYEWITGNNSSRHI